METLNDTVSGFTLTKDLQSFTSDPVPGLWHMVVVVAEPGQRGRHRAAVRRPRHRPRCRGGSSGVAQLGPDETGARVVHELRLQVTNPGVQPIFVGVDPRLEKMVTLTAVPIQGQSTFDLPPDPSLEPIYNAPPDTRA